MRRVDSTANAMIAFGATGSIAMIVNRAAHMIPPIAATIFVVCELYWLIEWAIAPLCAKLLRRAQQLST